MGSARADPQPLQAIADGGTQLSDVGRPFPPLACGSVEAAAAVRARMDPARAFFMRSVAEAYERIQAGRRIQADLYILAHFLLFQSSLHLEANPARAALWQRRIQDFFLKDYAQGVWKAEGCLTIKVLIGLRLVGAPLDEVHRLARHYRSFIAQRWGRGGVGECAEPGVERTYGQTLPPGPVMCGPVSLELVAKTAYYQALIGDDGDDALADVPLPTLNEPPELPFREWAQVIPAKWLIRTYRLPASRSVSRGQFERVRRALREAIAAAPPGETPVRTIFLSPLLYASWLAGDPIDPRSYELFRIVLSTQWADGRIPSPYTALRDKGHNVDASTTYQALMAMTEFLRRQSNCTAQISPPGAVSPGADGGPVPAATLGNGR